jgi:hypothetical protein
VQTVFEQPSEFPTITICPYIPGYFNNYSLFTSINPSGTRFGYDLSVGTDPKNHFEVIISQQYDICFRFNSGKNFTNHTIPIKKSFIGGREDIFRLSLIKNFESDLVLWIHNRSSPPSIQLLNNNDDLVVVSKRSNNFIAIDRAIEYKLGKPYSECYKDSSTFEKNKTIINHILKKGELYTQIKCLELCFEVNYILNNTCNCTDTKLGSVWLDCWIRKENKLVTSCTYISRKNFYENKIVEFCAQYCPLECNTTLFAYTLSSVDSKDLNTNIQVYYRSLKFTSITQQAKMSWIDLVSSLGGSLSLFIGLSFVTLFEIIEILIQVGLIIIGKNFKCNRKNENQQSIEIEARLMLLEQLQRDTRRNTYEQQEYLDTRIKEIEKRLHIKD